MKNAEGEDILVPEGQSKIWNYHPNLPVPNSPVFRWRPRIGFVLNWFRRGWFALSGATIWVALAFVAFTWFQPSLAEWSLEGIISMLLRNLFLIFIIAGGLHLWLWAMRFQGDRLKFDIRDMMRDNGTFTFRNQVFDNMFWSIAWGVHTPSNRPEHIVEYLVSKSKSTIITHHITNIEFQTVTLKPHGPEPQM